MYPMPPSLLIHLCKGEGDTHPPPFCAWFINSNLSVVATGFLLGFRYTHWPQLPILPKLHRDGRVSVGPNPSAPDALDIHPSASQKAGRSLGFSNLLSLKLNQDTRQEESLFTDLETARSFYRLLQK